VSIKALLHMQPSAKLFDAPSFIVKKQADLRGYLAHIALFLGCVRVLAAGDIDLEDRPGQCPDAPAPLITGIYVVPVNYREAFAVDVREASAVTDELTAAFAAGDHLRRP
jgi:hypothetical protein